MKKRVAIITHYYNSVNYGGNLQSYALPTFLNKKGYKAEQICYSIINNQINRSLKARIKGKIGGSPFSFIKSLFYYAKNKVSIILHKNDISNFEKIIERRRESSSHFQLDLIPHTKNEFSDELLNGLNSEYDVFITGSDQVFNFNMARKAYFLNFVNDEIPKFSYAASMALDSIPDDKKSFIKDTLVKYKAIGIREEKTIDLLSTLVDKEMSLNVDPVFLLEKEDWDAISSSRIVKEEYVFCYFLGDNKSERKYARKFATKNNLKIVCIPCCVKSNKLIDENFGDYNFPYAAPEDFISFVANASYIFTDSYHACAFSFIYSKKFIVFNRDNKGSMSSRIYSLMNLFHADDRFLKNNSYSFETVDARAKDTTIYDTNDFYKAKEQSIKFLLDNLG